MRQNKAVVTYAAKCWNQCHIFPKHSIPLYAALPVAVAYTSKSQLLFVADADFLPN